MATTATPSNAGRKPRANEKRLPVQTKLPETLFKAIFAYVEQDLNLSRSDFVAIATVEYLNKIRGANDLREFPMPGYLMGQAETLASKKKPAEEKPGYVGNLLTSVAGESPVEEELLAS